MYLNLCQPPAPPPPPHEHVLPGIWLWFQWHNRRSEGKERILCSDWSVSGSFNSLTHLLTSVLLCPPLSCTTCSCLVVAYLCCCASGQAGQSCCFWYLPVMESSWRLSLLSSTSCTTNCLASTAEAESVSILAIHPVPIHNLLNALFVARAISEKEWTVARPRTGKSTIQFNCSGTVTG